MCDSSRRSWKRRVAIESHPMSPTCCINVIRDWIKEVRREWPCLRTHAHARVLEQTNPHRYPLKRFNRRLPVRSVRASFFFFFFFVYRNLHAREYSFRPLSFLFHCDDKSRVSQSSLPGGGLDSEISEILFYQLH